MKKKRPSTSLFICSVCGAEEKGKGMTLCDASMVKCSRGHVYCRIHELKLQDCDKPTYRDCADSLRKFFRREIIGYMNRDDENGEKPHTIRRRYVSHDGEHYVKPVMDTLASCEIESITNNWEGPLELCGLIHSYTLETDDTPTAVRLLDRCQECLWQDCEIPYVVCPLCRGALPNRFEGKAKYKT